MSSSSLLDFVCFKMLLLTGKSIGRVLWLVKGY
jgi:hypothetical protein